MLRSRVSSLAALVALSFAASCSDDDSPSPNTGADASVDGGRTGTLDGGIDGSTTTPSLTDDQYKAQITTKLHDLLLVDLNNLKAAAQDLQSNAPDHAWDATADAAAMTKMRDAWTRARTAYEHIEGALAPLFSEIDFTIDARYDDFLAENKGEKDPNPFDDEIVTGLHAAERIMWAQQTRPSVVAFEASLPGYTAAAFPATAQEASDFKNKLAAKIVSDAQLFIDGWTPAKIDIQQAFTGLISLMNEQHEKVTKAASNEEESRYSQTTMNDIRDNLQGTKNAYELFAPWLKTKTSANEDSGLKGNGVETDAAIESGFATLSTLYSATTGAGFPEVPSTWLAEGEQSPADLASPFGKLYTGVLAATNTEALPSVVMSMNHAAYLLGYEQFVEGE